MTDIDVTWKNEYRRNICGICEKKVSIFDPSIEMKDQWIEVIWHKSCARSYEEWARKMDLKHKTAPPTYEYPIDMEKYLEELQKKR